MMRIGLAVFLLSFSACVSTRTVLDPNASVQRAPDYEDYFDYYLLGFSGEPQVGLPSVCLDQKPVKVEQVRTVEDGLLTAVTLGIYAPMTVRVWCGD
jgi:hypothetical protein